MHASLFCLAPTGSGWGVRLKFALMSGCIPVLIDDRVRVRAGQTLQLAHLLGMSCAACDWAWHASLLQGACQKCTCAQARLRYS